MLKQLRSEWMRGRGRPVEKYTGAIALVLGTLVPVVMMLVSTRNASIRTSVLQTLAFPASLNAARTMAAIVGPFWAAAIGANIVGAEYQYGTWPWLLVRSSSRLRLIVVKVLAMAARIAAVTVAGISLFVAMAAIIRTAYGMPVIAGAGTTAGQVAIPFLSVAGAMVFAAVIGLTITVASRSVAFGTITGALALPLCLAIRVKDTAPWIPYVHLQNVEERLLTGQPSPLLTRFLEFNMSARASTGIISVELLVLLAVAYVLFRRQEIVY